MCSLADNRMLILISFLKIDELELDESQTVVRKFR